jgi:hypothetical protein
MATDQDRTIIFDTYYRLLVLYQQALVDNKLSYSELEELRQKYLATYEIWLTCR